MNYKGMNQDMTCHGFQFEVGKEYEHKGKVKCCPSDEELKSGAGGFHACEYPLDVLRYYSPANSRFFEVEQWGKTDKSGDDTKVCSQKIKIGAEIGLDGLIKAAFEYTKIQCKNISEESNDRSFASATGDGGVALATGYRGAASATGDCGAALAKGYRGAASATGYQGAASATGYQGTALAAGYRGAASATGKHSVAVSTGIGGMAKGRIGCAICVVERGDWDGESYPIINIKSAIVDGEIIKEGTWYTLKNGEFLEAKIE